MTPKEISALLAQNAAEVVEYLLPNARKRGREYVIGSVDGEPGKSLSVCVAGPNAGVWKDFADNNPGGDLLDLWCAARKIPFAVALAEAKEYLGVRDDRNMFHRAKKAYKKPKKPVCRHPSRKMLEWFAGRGISPEIIKRLKVSEKDGAIVFPSLSPDGELELVKYRSLTEKKFWSNSDPIPCLFGWQGIEDDHRDVVICEGEIDCLTYWQQGIPALSVPRGGGGGGKQDWIAYEFDRLERFRTIYVSMDSDDAGSIAKDEIINRLGRHRCKVVSLRRNGIEYKDANEVHMSGVDLSWFLDRAVTEDPEELRRLSEFHDDVVAGINCTIDEEIGVFLPWSKTRKDVKLRRGETTVWGGINSHGKSNVISQVIVDGVAQGEKWCVASMEMPPAMFGNVMYRQIGLRPGDDDVVAAKVLEFIHDGVWLFTSYGTAKARKILEVFEYARKRYGINNFVIDSLSKCGFAEDDYSGQKQFVDEVAEFAMDRNVHVHLVVHLRKQKTEHEMPNKFSVKGTGAIIDMVSNAFIVWRNKQKEELLSIGDESKIGEPDMVLDCVKQRKTGVEPRYNFWFDPQSRQFTERCGDAPKQYIF